MLHQNMYMQAVDFMRKRGFSEEQCEVLVEQLQRYKVGAGPFAAPLSAQGSVTVWWQSLQDEESVIVDLAVALYDLVPHAAATERHFSQMKWYNADRRCRQSVHTINMLATIKAYLQHHMPQQAIRKPGGIAGVHNELRAFASSLLDSLGSESEEPHEVEEQIEHDEVAVQLNEWFMADCSNRWASVSSELLFLSDEAHFDLSNPAWQPGFVPAVQAARRVGNLGAAPRGTGFSSADLVNRMMQ